MVQQKLIGTHDGTFHCDEVFACYMLKQLPQFATHNIVRTRDPKILDTCDIVVDVGAVYDPTKCRYDHHQRGFTETMNSVVGLNFETKLSSAGLIYAHYGKGVLAKMLDLNEFSEDLSKIYERIYKIFVESVDAIDNGIKQFEGEPKYQLSSTLASRVSHCNPAWNDKSPDPEGCFTKAMGIVREEFEQRVHYLADSWLPARKFVADAIQRRKEVHPSGKILALEPSGLPWKDHFFDFEKELGLQGADICLVVYEDQSASWRIQAIPVSETSGFDNRIALPWKGYRDVELEQESGVQGAIFVHISGFIGGAKTRDGVMKMAEETLKQAGRWGKN